MIGRACAMGLKHRAQKVFGSEAIRAGRATTQCPPHEAQELALHDPHELLPPAPLTGLPPLLAKNVEIPRWVSPLPQVGQSMGVSASFIARRTSNCPPQVWQ